MPQFQETNPRRDDVAKRPLTVNDMMFLLELQKKLNTQDTMGNADPRFWAIAQTEEMPCPEDMCDRVVAVDGDGDTIARDLKSFAEWLDGNNCEGVAGCAYFNKSVTIKFEDGTKKGAFDLGGAVQAILDHGGQELRLVPVRDVLKIIPDTMFLTHEACEAHLEAYGYNYQDDAHAYAMTAIRSPEFERLIKLLQSADWGSLQVAGGKA